jgi:hypothetical protein
LLPDITDGPLPMVQHGTVCRPQNSFGPRNASRKCVNLRRLARYRVNLCCRQPVLPLTV